MIHRLGLISDLHMLQKYALVPPKFRIAGGSAVDPTAKYQEYLWDCWLDFAKRVPPLEVLIINGDIIHGRDKKQYGVEVVSSDLTDQAQAFVYAVGLLRDKVGKLWITRGTSYHEDMYEAVEWAATELDAEKWGPNRRTGNVLEGVWQGRTFNVTHHMTRGFIYKGTAASRTSLLAAAAEAEGKVNRADIIVRSHLHMKYVGKPNGKWVIFTPGWSLLNPYAVKTLEYYRGQTMSDIGAIILSTDGKGPLTVDDETFRYAPYKEELKPLG